MDLTSAVNSVITHTEKKSVPVYKWNIKYSGDDDFSLKSFLDRVNELCVARRVDKDAVFAPALDLFSGSALLWFRSIKNQVNSWDGLVNKLKADFLPPGYKERL